MTRLSSDTRFQLQLNQLTAAVGRPRAPKVANRQATQVTFCVRGVIAPPSIVFCSTQWHYTPKHGSWLDMAESELGVIASQCLNRRIADKKILAREAWQDHRNRHHAKANWQFKTA